MAKKKRNPGEIHNPEHYFNSFISKEIKRDRAQAKRYYKMFVSLEEILDGGTEGISTKIQMKLSTNVDGRDLEDAFAGLSEFGWIEQIEDSRLLRAIRTLTDQQKMLISLRYSSCYTQAETARLMGLSQQAVSCYEKRILEKLRKALLSNQGKL